MVGVTCGTGWFAPLPLAHPFPPGAPFRGQDRTHFRPALPFMVRTAPISALRSLSWSGPHQYAPRAPEVTGAIGGYGSDDDGWLGPIAWRAAKGWLG